MDVGLAVGFAVGSLVGLADSELEKQLVLPWG